ncbi:hypothetical protein [Winogradskyella haliclonae]|uniref:Leucine-rich repeat domain-containing protein n=1 Tax=Winogradskyella haliclonae TaxID=2048558 RepID=A0ABQ2BYB4_9FLAO|nr:hypothetical protein [Winogradskyella haliclonae]GGI56885.1 hypothetical protein GCM10011444_11940 [Winogradskyella haliclonae]
MGIFNRKKKWGNFNGNINIYSDLEKSDIPKIIKEDDIHSLQLFEFQTPNRQTWETLNEFYKDYPDIGLRVVWYDCEDLSFYELIPNIRSFTIATYKVKDYSILKSNCKLKHFGIEETKSKAVDLSFIKEFQDLESLYVDGMKKGLENAKYLPNLKTLTFRGVKLDNLDFLTELIKLQELNLLFGSYKNLDSLSKLKQLKSIEFSRVRQISNFDFLNSLENLEKIEFEGMSKMESIPNLSKLKNLKRVHIHNNLRLNDIKSVGEIPNLKLLQLSFAENQKSSERKNLISQSVEILMKSNTLEYTNVLHWTDEKTTKELTEKGIKMWSWNIKI